MQFSIKPGLVETLNC